MYESKTISSPEAIEAELCEMQAFLESEYTADNTAALSSRLILLTQHMSRSGKLKADAEHHYHKVYTGSVMSSLKSLAESSMSVSMVNEYVKSMCGSYKHLITWADRVNRSCTHQIDSIRTLISFAKSEINYR